MESHKGGPIMLTKYAQLSQEYLTEKERYQNNVTNRIFKIIDLNPFKAKYSRKAAKKFYTYEYLENADKTKYNSILKNLNQQNSFGNNQYNKSNTKANNILNNHKFGGGYSKQKQNQKFQHIKKDQDIQEKEEVLSLTFTQIEGKCYCCGKKVINSHNADIKINQKMNGLSTKYNLLKTLQKI